MTGRNPRIESRLAALEDRSLAVYDCSHLSDAEIELKLLEIADAAEVRGDTDFAYFLRGHVQGTLTAEERNEWADAMEAPGEIEWPAQLRRGGDDVQ